MNTQTFPQKTESTGTSNSQPTVEDQQNQCNMKYEEDDHKPMHDVVKQIPINSIGFIEYVDNQI